MSRSKPSEVLPVHTVKALREAIAELPEDLPIYGTNGAPQEHWSLAEAQLVFDTNNQPQLLIYGQEPF